MTTELVSGPPYYDVKFWWFLRERHHIYLRKTRDRPAPQRYGPDTWTTDPVLQEYHFCNVYRELDAVTIWIRENIRARFADTDALLIHLCIARQFNYVPTLYDFAQIWHGYGAYREIVWRGLQRVLRERITAKERVFNSAYMITGAGVPSGWSKGRHVLENVCRPLTGDAELLTLARGDSIEAFCSHLRHARGWGWFLAYEVACDLRHCPGWLDTAEDINTWANPGPGARRGLNRIYARSLEEPVPRAQLIDEMVALLAAADIPRNWPPLELREIEHTLCEYDKWRRGGGKKRYRQRGTTNA